jgi:hypothetical protein
MRRRSCGGSEAAALIPRALSAAVSAPPYQRRRIGAA